jgi:hypothetical protein
MSKDSVWIKLTQAGAKAELLLFLPLATVGIGLGMVLGIRGVAGLGVMVFGTPFIFWLVVYHLAWQDAQEKGEE